MLKFKYNCTEENRINEERFIKKFTDLVARHNPGESYSYVHHPEHGHLYDGTLYKDGAPIAIIEVKGRKGHSYPDTWDFSNDKFQRLVAAAERKGLRFFLAFTWEDGDFYCEPAKFADKTLAVKTGGRYDRPDDPKSIEPMVKVPVHVFRKI